MDNLILKDRLYHRPFRCEKCGGRYKKCLKGIYECENCGQRAMDDYGKVRLYVEENPGATIAEVVVNTGVSRQLVKQMVEDGKFDLINR